MCERLRALIEADGAIRVVGQAQTPREAIAGILACQPDAVVLDIHLREGNGLEVIREVFPQAPQMVFVVVSSDPDPQYRRAFAQAGASVVLDKSSEFNRICEEILSACAARRSQWHEQCS